MVNNKNDVVLFQYSQMEIAFTLILMLKIHDKRGDFTCIEGLKEISDH